MSSVQKSTKLIWRRTRRGTQRRIMSRVRSSQARCCRGGSNKFKSRKSKLSNSGYTKVTERLEALKNLIPHHQNGEIVNAEQLFLETASYIVTLRTQVMVLQKLIECYGSSRIEKEEEHAAT